MSEQITKNEAIGIRNRIIDELGSEYQDFKTPEIALEQAVEDLIWTVDYVAQLEAERDRLRETEKT